GAMGSAPKENGGARPPELSCFPLILWRDHCVADLLDLLGVGLQPFLWSILAAHDVADYAGGDLDKPVWLHGLADGLYDLPVLTVRKHGLEGDYDCKLLLRRLGHGFVNCVSAGSLHKLS